VGIRIWHQSGLDLDAYPSYRASLERHYREVLSDDTEVALHGVPAGVWGAFTPSEVGISPYVYHQVMSHLLLEAAVAAEDGGYDAFILGSYIEPLLREARSAVNIPVLSMLESAVLVGCSVAPLVGLVTLNDWNLWMIRNALERHKLMPRIAGIWVAEEDDERDIEEMFRDPAPYVARFLDSARLAIDQYADAILPAEGVIAELIYRAGVREVGQVSVLDGIGIPLLYAEMMAKAHRRTGLTAGRRWHYRRIEPEVVRELLNRNHAKR
jgi:allantoin racemase